jgi:hypothetical protein
LGGLALLLPRLPFGYLLCALALARPEVDLPVDQLAQAPLDAAGELLPVGFGTVRIHLDVKQGYAADGCCVWASAYIRPQVFTPTVRGDRLNTAAIPALGYRVGERGLLMFVTVQRHPIRHAVDCAMVNRAALCLGAYIRRDFESASPLTNGLERKSP